MGKYIGIAKPYLITVTIFVLLRFPLELAGVSPAVTSEISLTRLIFILPIFLGLRFARQSLGGFKEMVLTNFVYCFWGVFLVMIATALDIILGLGTHYGEPPEMSLAAHLLGHVVEIVVLTLLTSIICLITAKLNKGAAQPETSAV
ncbi:hypothetical protein MYX78_02780 [Acidobacteria bacterium AH-259-G07]|nr:hypothetical protein [Acidobacteria bacterium AH-259-G07]